MPLEAIQPGATALPRTPDAPPSPAAVWVKLTMPARAAPEVGQALWKRSARLRFPVHSGRALAHHPVRPDPQRLTAQRAPCWFRARQAPRWFHRFPGPERGPLRFLRALYFVQRPVCRGAAPRHPVSRRLRLQDARPMQSQHCQTRPRSHAAEARAPRQDRWSQRPPQSESPALWPRVLKSLPQFRVAGHLALEVWSRT